MKDNFLITEKLPVEWKNKWIKALKSGKFKKGTCTLYNAEKDEYCCLGVACSISGMEIDNYKEKGIITDDLIGNEKVPKMLVEGSEPHATSNQLVWKLTSLNDNCSTFDNVIEYIKTNL